MLLGKDTSHSFEFKTYYYGSYVMGFALCEKATQLVDNAEQARSYFDKVSQVA